MKGDECSPAAQILGKNHASGHHSTQRPDGNRDGTHLNAYLEASSTRAAPLQLRDHIISLLD